MFIEKYRPKDFEDIKGQDHVVNRIRALVEQGNMLHLLFSGPAGVGKTSLALVIAKKLYGDLWKENFLELNASDERGIDVIRNKVKDFARTKAMRDIPFKIIYLDECDSLTKEAQHALRRIMENYSNICRFILSCNYSSKIIDPIHSRCAVFRFKPLEEEYLKEILMDIAKKEGIKMDKSALEAICKISSGDARKAENILQSCAVMGHNIDEKLVYEVASAARPKEIIDVLKLSLGGDFVKARDLLLNTMLKHGLSGLDIVKQIQQEIMNLDINDERKARMIEKCGEIEFRMVEGSDEFVQLEALIASFYSKNDVV
jgi:replication factor C small subunit